MRGEIQPSIPAQNSDRSTSHPAPEELAGFVNGCLPDQATYGVIEAHLELCAECLQTATRISADDFQVRVRRLEETSGGMSQGTATPAIRLTSGYELLGELGRGGAGVVYRARQAGLDREVAFKTLLAGSGASAQQLARFRHESLALGRLDHPHIVKIFDVGEQEGAPFLAMELVVGGTLGELLRLRPLEIDAAVRLLQSLADAVHAAHEQGVLHRDLKPQNILLHAASTDRPKIVDFGLSHLFQLDESITRTGDPLGTPSYMAPEQVLGDKQQLTRGCDVYGLGAIFYECIAGRPPFRGATALETMEMVLRQDPVPLRQVRPGLPRDLETICHRALEKDPARRYPSAAALRDDLAAFKASRPIVARPRSRTYRTALWVRRNPWPAAWCVTVALGLLAGSIFLFVSRYRLAAERDRASQQYAVARSAIWSMIQVADQRDSFQVPMLSELTLDQARHALRLFEDLAREAPSREADLDLARIRMHTGTLLLALGQTKEGESLMSLASERLTQLVDASTVSTDELQALLASQGKLAVALITQRRLDEARHLLEPAIALAKRFQAAQPGNISLTSSVGWLYDHWATIGFHAQDPVEMKNAIVQAIDYHQQALKLDPKNQAQATQLAESRANLAQAECQLGDLSASEREFNAAIEVLESLTSPQAPNPRILIALAVARLNLSNVLAARENPEGAVETCTRGLQEVETLLAVEPNYADAREHRYQLYGNRGQYRAVLKEFDGAIADWQAAVDTATNDAIKPYCRCMKIGCLVEAGKLDVAEQECQAMESQSLAPSDQFLLATVCGKLGNALAAQGEAERAQERFDRAAEIVGQLRELGHFKENPGARDLLMNGDDFREVRPRLAPQFLESLALPEISK